MRPNKAKYRSRKKIAVFAAFAVSAFMSLSAFAEIDQSLVAPEASVVFYVHGHLNIVFTSNETTKAYAVYAANTKEATFEYDVETCPSGGGEWTSHSGELSKYTNNSGDFRDTSRFYWRGSTELDSAVQVRARIRITKAGDAKYGAWSEWGNLGTAEVLREISGAIIQSPSPSAGYQAKADDGDVNTFYEDSASEPSWTGIDAGAEAIVTRIRFTHRNFNDIVRNRGKNAVFEAACSADFSDAVLLYTVPTTYDPYAVNDIVLDTPARARYFRVRTSKSNCCNFTEVQWVGVSCCSAVLAGDGGEDDYRARVSVGGDVEGKEWLRLLRGYSQDGPVEAITGMLPPSDSLVVTDEVSGVGLPCYYRWECSMDGIGVMTGAVSSVYIRPRQLERDASDQTTLAAGVGMLPVNAIFPDVTYIVQNSALCAFDGGFGDSSSPNVYATSAITNPVVGVELPQAAHLACVFVNADCRNPTRTPRMRNLAFYGAEDSASLPTGGYVQLTGKIKTYVQADDGKWFRYNSTDTNGLYNCLFGYSPVREEWGGHSREIRFVGWTEGDEIASGKVLAPAGVTVRPGRSVVVGWTAAVNATTLKISRRLQGASEWTLVAADVDPSAMAYVDNGKLRGGMVYEYKVEATGLGGLMSVAADPVLVAVPKRGTSIIVR